MGKIKEGKGTTIGNAGEYLVVGELLRRGVIAALAPRNTPGFDILATNGTDSLNVRVKTKTDAADSWVWNAKKDGTIFTGLKSRADFTVLVDLKEENSQPEYYAVPTMTLDGELRAIFQRWLGSLPKRGKSHNPNNHMRRIGTSEYQQQWLSGYKGAWTLILRELEAGSSDGAES